MNTHDILAAINISLGCMTAECMTETPELQDIPPAQGEDTGGSMPTEGFCAGVGRKLLGHVSEAVERDVARITEMVRTYPIRPYLVQGGGSGFNTQRGQWRDENWHLVKEFSKLWWSAAGDAVIAKHGRRLPIRPAEYTGLVYRSQLGTDELGGATK